MLWFCGTCLVYLSNYYSDKRCIDEKLFSCRNADCTIYFYNWLYMKINNKNIDYYFLTNDTLMQTNFPIEIFSCYNFSTYLTFLTYSKKFKILSVAIIGNIPGKTEEHLKD